MRISPHYMPGRWWSTNPRRVAVAAAASFTPDKIGSYTFALLVTDNDGATDRDTVTMVVNPGAFTVDAGPDQTVVWRTTVQLAGSYVAEGGRGTVIWRMAIRPASASSVPAPASSLTPTFFAESVGTYVAELEVTSPAGIATDTVTITVVAPPPQLIDGDIVDVDSGHHYGVFGMASVNPSRLRLLQPVWPTVTLEAIIPLSVTPTAIGISEIETFVSVIHDSTRVTVASTASLSEQSTLDLGVPLLDVRHGAATPRVYPAQAGPLLLLDHMNGVVYPGGLVPGPARGREFPSAERPLYALDIGPSAKLRRDDAHAEDTTLVRGNDLWFALDAVIVSSGHVFHTSEDPAIDMTHRGLLPGDQPFEIVGVRGTSQYVVTLHNRITTPPQLPESQVRFYNWTTLALEHVVPLPDLVVGEIPQRTLGRGLTVTGTPGRVYVIGSAGSAAALFTVPVP